MVLQTAEDRIIREEATNKYIRERYNNNREPLLALESRGVVQERERRRIRITQMEEQMEEQLRQMRQMKEEQLRQMRQMNERGSSNPKYQAAERGRKLYNSNKIPNEMPNEMPNDFKCPISQKIMKNPVIAADGHTYERVSIETWLTSNDTSPKTGDVLPHLAVIPNDGLKSIINTWLEYKSKYKTYKQHPNYKK